VSEGTYAVDYFKNHVIGKQIAQCFEKVAKTVGEPKI
jgi:hypothetical protein